MDESDLLVTSGPPDKAVYAVGVRLRYCDCDKFHVPPGSVVTAESHVIISREVIEVGKSHSAAISYAWGQFQRQPILIGHLSDEGQSGKPIPVTLELGKEWEHAAFVEKLVYWSNHYHSIWIDQLCIPQQADDPNRDVLTSIPAMFRNLHVLLFRPGPRCKCLEAWLERNDSSEKIAVIASNCFNAIDVCSHFDRIWTLQEFRCAQNLRVVPVSPRVLPCARRIDRMDDDSLNPFLRSWIGENSGQFLGRRKNMTEYVRRMMVNFVVDLMLSLTRKMAIVDDSKMARFWMGDEAVEFATPKKQPNSKFEGTVSLDVATENPKSNSRSGTKSEKMSEQEIVDVQHSYVPPSRGIFPTDDEALATLSIAFIRDMQPRVKATKQRDYILSVWTDSFGYSIPEGYRKMSVLSLYEDAMQQFERVSSRRFLTFTPSGLFRSTLPSCTLRPTEFLKTFAIANADDLYGLICKHSSPFKTTPSGHFRFCKAKGGDRPLSSKACFWTDPKLGSTVTEKLELLTNMTLQWPRAIKMGAFRRLERFYPAEDEFSLRVMDYQVALQLHEAIATAPRLRDLAIAMASQKSDHRLEQFLRGPCFHSQFRDITRLTAFAVQDIIGEEKRISKLAPLFDSLSPDFCSDVAMKVAQLALGMQPDTCERHGIVPLATYDDLGVPLLGMFREDASILGPHKPEDTQTVKFESWQGGPIFGEPLYEVVRISEQQNFPRDVGDEHLPHYKVCGVWLPTNEPKGITGAASFNHNEYDMIVA